MAVLLVNLLLDKTNAHLSSLHHAVALGRFLDATVLGLQLLDELLIKCVLVKAKMAVDAKSLWSHGGTALRNVSVASLGMSIDHMASGLRESEIGVVDLLAHVALFLSLELLEVVHDGRY